MLSILHLHEWFVGLCRHIWAVSPGSHLMSWLPSAPHLPSCLAVCALSSLTSRVIISHFLSCSPVTLINFWPVDHAWVPGSLSLLHSHTHTALSSWLWLWWVSIVSMHLSCSSLNESLPGVVLAHQHCCQCCNGDVDRGGILIFVSAAESPGVKTGTLLL